MKTLFLFLVLGLSSLVAQAEPLVVTRLVVCPESRNLLTSETVTWLKDGDKQSITFDDVNGPDLVASGAPATQTSTYPVVSTQLTSTGATELTYNLQGRNASINIYCDAIMTEAGDLLTTFNCDKNR